MVSRLPSYQAFNRRLNLLDAAFDSIGKSLLTAVADDRAGELDHLIDSMSVMLAKGAFARREKVARDVADIGYCAAKRLHFHGVRLHLIATRRSGRLPVPKKLWLREGSCHDLSALKERMVNLPGATLIGDKAYCDRQFESRLQAAQTKLLVPKKKPKGKDQSAGDKFYSRLISRIRQPIESLFKWLIDKTDIQRASSVRSTDGLLVHCFGKLTFALLLLVFYS